MYDLAVVGAEELGAIVDAEQGFVLPQNPAVMPDAELRSRFDEVNENLVGFEQALDELISTGEEDLRIYREKLETGKKTAEPPETLVKK